MSSDKYILKKFRDFLEIAPLSHAFWRTTEALAFRNVKLQKPVLDLGCGFGEFSGVAFGKIEMGVDINQRDLKMAAVNRKYSKLLLADARKLPFPDSNFNTVISVSVLEHIPRAQEAIKEVHRVLRTGGKFILTVPTNALEEQMLVPRVCRLLKLSWLEKFYIHSHKKFFGHKTWKTSIWWEKILKKEKFIILDKHGTVSQRCLWLHELFLPMAFPSQIWKWVFGKRLVIMKDIRRAILPILFGPLLEMDLKSDINLFIIAQKNK